MPDAPPLRPMNIVVRDMDAAVSFYRLLGVDIPDTVPEWNAHHRTTRIANGIELELDSEASTRTWSHGLRARASVLGFDDARRFAPPAP